MATEECVFCARVAREEYDLWATSPGSRVVSFVPLNPVVPGHRLFLPMRHVADAASKPWLTGDVFAQASVYAMGQGCAFNLITSAGTEATQSIRHLHVHYVPRREGDLLPLPWAVQGAGGWSHTTSEEPVVASAQEAYVEVTRTLGATARRYLDGTPWPRHADH